MYRKSNHETRLFQHVERTVSHASGENRLPRSHLARLRAAVWTLVILFCFPSVGTGGRLGAILSFGSSVRADDLPVELVGVATAEGLKECGRVAVSGQYACVLASSNVWLFDVSDARNPRYVGRAPFTCDHDNVGTLVVAGAFAYVTGWAYQWDPEWHYIDVSFVKVFSLATPGAPQQVGEYTVNGHAGPLVVRDSYAYWLHGEIVYHHAPQFNQWYRRLVVLGVSNPQSPYRIGHVELAVPNPWYTLYEELAATGNCLYVVRQGGMDVYALSNPGAPVKIGSYSCELSEAIVGKDNYVYALLHAPVAIDIISVANPSSPTRVSRVPLTGSSASGLAVMNGYVLARVWPGGTASSGWQVVDVTNPTAARFVGTWAGACGYSIAVGDR